MKWCSLQVLVYSSYIFQNVVLTIEDVSLAAITSVLGVILKK